MYSGVYNITPLPYPATQSLLPSSIKPQLYTSPKILHTCTFITITSITCFKYDYGAEICFYNIISVKLIIILLFPPYIFFYMDSLQTQMCNFIPCKHISNKFPLLILILTGKFFPFRFMDFLCDREKIIPPHLSRKGLISMTLFSIVYN